MKLLLVLFTTTLFACSQNKTENVQQPAIPKALEENKMDYSLISKSRVSNDLVQDLYNEILEKDKKLNELETEIRKTKRNKRDSLERFSAYDQQNNNYYRSAKNYLDQISDTVLRKQIEQTLTISSASYKNRISSHETLIKQADALAAKLHDLHIILKLSTTLAVMESYQKEQLPSKSPILLMNKTYNQLILRTDSLIKKQPNL
jgi:hypothetical protein